MERASYLRPQVSRRGTGGHGRSDASGAEQDVSEKLVTIPQTFKMTVMNFVNEPLRTRHLQTKPVQNLLRGRPIIVSINRPKWEEHRMTLVDNPKLKSRCL